MRLFLRLEDKQKSCAIWVVYLLRVTLQGNLKAPIYVKLMGKLEDGNDFATDTSSLESSKLIITVTDISDIDKIKSKRH